MFLLQLFSSALVESCSIMVTVALSNSDEFASLENMLFSTISHYPPQYHNILQNITISYIVTKKKTQTKEKWSHHTGTKPEVKQALGPKGGPKLEIRAGGRGVDFYLKIF